MKPPRLVGPALIAARTAAENPAGGAILSNILTKSLGIDRLRVLPDELRCGLPLSLTPLSAGRVSELEAQALPDPKRGVWPRTSGALASAIQDGQLDAATLAQRSYDAAKHLRDNRVQNVLVAEDAERTKREGQASAARHQAGRSLGPLDGVPYLVKDEVDVAGLPTRCGTLCESEDPRPDDATVVRRLHEAGAVFVGKTVMTEWGMSPLGQNVHYPMPHNAHHAERVPGGSSTGSGVGVALGVVPLAVGSDGGGSIRIPAALNGVFGLKATFGRISRAGNPSTSSVVHVGPLGASSRDLALFLDAVASEPDPLDPATLTAAPAPKAGFGYLLNAGVRKLRIGVVDSEWAEASPAVAKAGRAALAALEEAGAVLVPLRSRLLAEAAPIGYVTIGCEAVASNLHHLRERRHKMADDLRLSFAVLGGLSASDYLDAQRLRSALRKEMRDLFAQVDLFALPTTQTTAPVLPVAQRGRAFADTAAIDSMCRFAFVGNLTGLPAGTAPVGDEEGLPIGMQLMADAWHEAAILGALSELERIGVAVVRKPRAALDLLQ